MIREEIIKEIVEKGILLDSEVIDLVPDNLGSIFLDFLCERVNNKFLSKNDFHYILNEYNKRFVFNTDFNVELVHIYNDNFKKKEVQDFVKYFRNRYESIKNILIKRIELQSVISVIRLRDKREGDRVSLIGLVLEKSITKSGNCILRLEDTTGIIDVLIGKNKENLVEIVDEIVLDEILGVVGVLGKNIVFCNEIIFPDIPLNKELKRCDDEIYAAFIGDIHYGLNQFLEEEFSNFIDWINSDYGEQKEIASRLRYLFIVGDLVDGIGVYPGQEDDLKIKDIVKQYEGISLLLSRINSNVKIIICGGNHDAMRIAEPQPLFDKKICECLYKLDNVYLVTNPSLVNIHKINGFLGFDVLIYHGYSFIYYSDAVNSIRMKGGQERSDLVMRLLLKKRHLAPAHGSNLYIPDNRYDPLVIDKIPDFFISGHIHRIMVDNYKNVSLFNCSCWTTQTKDMEKRGIVPHPAKVPVVNLKTRDVRIINFLDSGVKNV